MIQRVIEQLRGRTHDEKKALETVRETSLREAREAFADYDRFVVDAKAVKGGLLLGTGKPSTGESVDIRLPWDDEYCHWLVQGGTGTGKTTWITSLLRQELARGRPAGVIDCKGDLFESVLRTAAAGSRSLAAENRERVRQRLVIVNPFSDQLVPLNVCRLLRGVTPEVQAYEMTLAFSRLFDVSLGLHMENILRHLFILLTEAELSLVEAPLVLQDEVLRGILAHQSSHPAVKEFFLGVYSTVPQASKDALLNRLQSLLLPENVRLMLGADALLDLGDVLDRGDPLLVFLGKGPGVPEEQVEVLGGLFLQLLFQATYARGSGQGRPYLLVIDEFVHLLNSPALARRFETALTTTRSFGLSLMLIHHNFAQLPPALRETALANTDLMALFRTSGRNAQYFGDFLPESDPEFADARHASSEDSRRQQLESLQRLPNRQCYWYDRRKSYRALRLRVPDVSSAHESAGLSKSGLDRVIREEGWNAGGAALSRTELRSQIEDRRKRLADLVTPKIRVSRPPTGPAESSSKPTGKRRPKLG